MITEPARTRPSGVARGRFRGASGAAARARSSPASERSAASRSPRSPVTVASGHGLLCGFRRGVGCASHRRKLAACHGGADKRAAEAQTGVVEDDEPCRLRGRQCRGRHRFSSDDAAPRSCSSKPPPSSSAHKEQAPCDLREGVDSFRERALQPLHGRQRRQPDRARDRIRLRRVGELDEGDGLPAAVSRIRARARLKARRQGF